MRFQKRFIVLGLLVVLVTVIKFQSAGEVLEEVEQFRGANIKEDVFSPMIAQSVNAKKMTVVLNDQRYNNDQNDIYMSDKLNIMVSTEVLMDGIRCAARLYEDNSLLILQGDTQVIMPLNERTILVNDRKVEVTEAATIHEGVVYVPLQPLRKALHFTLSWDMKNNAGNAVSTLKGSYLPSMFDLGAYGRISGVKDQGKLGTCWAFASLSAMESALLPEQNITFSADHMSMRNSFSSDQAQGGEYTMGMAYLTSWQGPVLEEEDPYGDGVSPNGLKPAKHVQEIQILENKNLEEIKEAVYKHGAVQTSLYFAPKYGFYYNKKNAAYYYNGTMPVNHDVVIVGWDDAYAASNFATAPEHDGAFICQNSWGDEFGMGGYFYVSYEDCNIGAHCLSYTNIESVHNFDRIYQSDLCGWGGQLGYNKDSLYAANVFVAKEKEDVEAAGFYATGTDTSYELYVVPEFTTIRSLRKGYKVADGMVKKAGYYTIRFDRSVRVRQGGHFAVVLKITTPGANRPLAVEYAKEGAAVPVDLTDGLSYISPNGKRWQNAEKTQKCNVCLKAYAKNVKKR
ncbi:Cysteine protease, C1A family [Lachnospiraceae bacterium XBB1006]|nr:Cysteine protease, C1A family [Lachnospiraceae bacterium XBB1006]